jgi:hypothetical protein
MVAEITSFQKTSYDGERSEGQETALFSHHHSSGGSIALLPLYVSSPNAKDNGFHFKTLVKASSRRNVLFSSSCSVWQRI